MLLQLAYFVAYVYFHRCPQAFVPVLSKIVLLQNSEGYVKFSCISVVGWSYNFGKKRMLFIERMVTFGLFVEFGVVGVALSAVEVSKERKEESNPNFKKLTLQ
uniref:Uncharacterized protein n=1 Tax=Solanum lycopersicum TaxID=4081 RepID=A0A3Q7FFT3_SOLLC